MMTMFEDDVRAALAAKSDAERQLAQAVTCPPWRHAIFGGMMAALVAKQALPDSAQFPVLGLIVVLIFVIIRSDRKRMGMFINGYRRGKTLFVTVPMLAIILGLYAASVYYAERGGALAIILGLSAAAFVISVVSSIIWQRIFVREMGA